MVGEVILVWGITRIFCFWGAVYWTVGTVGVITFWGNVWIFLYCTAEVVGILGKVLVKFWIGYCTFGWAYWTVEVWIFGCWAYCNCELYWFVFWTLFKYWFWVVDCVCVFV